MAKLAGKVLGRSHNARMETCLSDVKLVFSHLLRSVVCPTKPSTASKDPFVAACSPPSSPKFGKSDSAISEQRHGSPDTKNDLELAQQLMPIDNPCPMVTKGEKGESSARLGCPEKSGNPSNDSSEEGVFKIKKAPKLEIEETASNAKSHHLEPKQSPKSHEKTFKHSMIECVINGIEHEAREPPKVTSIPPTTLNMQKLTMASSADKKLDLHSFGSRFSAVAKPGLSLKGSRASAVSKTFEKSPVASSLPSANSDSGDGNSQISRLKQGSTAHTGKPKSDTKDLVDIKHVSSNNSVAKDKTSDCLRACAALHHLKLSPRKFNLVPLESCF